MLTSKPSDFQPSLKDEYLSQVANWLLDEWYATEDDLVRETDGPYTRGTTRFGRQKQRITNEFLSQNHIWLGLENCGNDLVFTIGGIPCRFTNDSATTPTKKAVLETHRYQMPLLEEAEPNHAARFCFVVDSSYGGEESEPKVSLLGYSSTNMLVCQWQSAQNVRTLTNIKQEMPAAVEIAKPVVVPKRRLADDDIAASV
ncbi:MAG: hypothetical protein PHQ58_21315 [Rhodoferax sp.]|uniref:hypothetical protein n=1 Tax=Rhodoferax sp. TaxID=50421 RepID=UPI00260D5FBA|nr:hypothetical protein [Rhodoferax sp.]MDD2882959.1 hypothetical protein [Rhodoferax sp.]